MAGGFLHCYSRSSTKERAGEHRGKRHHGQWCRHCDANLDVYLATDYTPSAICATRAFKALGWVDDKVIGWLCPACAKMRRNADQETADRMSAVVFSRLSYPKETPDAIYAKILTLRAEIQAAGMMPLPVALLLPSVPDAVGGGAR